MKGEKYGMRSEGKEVEEIGNLKNEHKHPLILYQYGKPNANEKGICSKCHKQWKPPAFRCYACDFHIHQSCIQLPPEIRTPFHPHHKSPLLLLPKNTHCKCCGQKPIGETYSCSECDFVIDLQCVIAGTKATGITQVEDGEFRHFAHAHPLSFQQPQPQQWGNKIVVCFVCNHRIKSDSSTYVCSLSNCDSHFHQQCAELSREIRDLRYHQHPLLLFARSFGKDYNICNSCRNNCFNFFYSCPPCKFNLHVACLSSFQHQHDFVKLFNVFAYTCQLCGKNSEAAIPWFCSICHLVAHKNCAELPTLLPATSLHPHPLNLSFSHAHHRDICKICGKKINMSFARYACLSCDYDAHLKCAEMQQKCDRKTMTKTKNKILHNCSQNHKLSLCPGEDNRHCNGCMQCIVTESYGCSKCGFYLHEECARLPTQGRISPLHSHELNLVYIPDFMFSCSVCQQYCHGFAYHCEKCHYAIDIRCAAITFPFTHASHDHPLFPFDDYKGKDHKCGGCGEEVKNKLVFGCDDCNFYLDAKCANLPLAVRNRFDKHPLSLTFESNKDDEEEEEEYYCDICEEGRERNEWFYYCKMCCFAAHLSCALGDYPFVKSAKFEGHRHPLNLVTKGKEGYSGCGGCGHSCEGNLALECGHSNCKFNVHAFGLCYHKQVIEGGISFIMPSLYSRSLALYLDPIQRKRGILLRRNGGGSWKESDLLGIKEFMVNDGRWIESIDICYYEEKYIIIGGDGDYGGGSTSSKEEDDNKYVAMSLGEYGRLEGRCWDDGAASTIIQKVEINHEKSINSITTTYDDTNNNNGTSTWTSERHGGIRGDTSTVNLKYPDEYLISIRGYSNYYGIGSLTLESNKEIYGPFGIEEGTRFCFPTSGAAKIVSFHGRSSNYLNSIGIKVLPIHNNNNIEHQTSSC